MSVVNKLITYGCVMRLHVQVNFLFSSPSATLSTSELFKNYLKTSQYDREFASRARSPLVKSFVLRCGCRETFTSDTQMITSYTSSLLLYLNDMMIDFYLSCYLSVANMFYLCCVGLL